MDAGVPITAPVAGVAMGLVMEGKKYARFSPTSPGAEDHYGDMDFKVAGTTKAITGATDGHQGAGVTTQILAEALEQAREARMHDPRNDRDQGPSRPVRQHIPYAPRIVTIQIPTTKSAADRPGGKMIRGIIEQTGARSTSKTTGKREHLVGRHRSARPLHPIITDLVAEAEVEKTYLGQMVQIVDFGAFVEIFPGTDGLLHISEIAENRIKEVRDELNEGDQILVKVLALEGNKIKLSRRAILKEQREKLKTEAKA